MAGWHARKLQQNTTATTVTLTTKTVMQKTKRHVIKFVDRILNY